MQAEPPGQREGPQLGRDQGSRRDSAHTQHTIGWFVLTSGARDSRDRPALERRG